MLLSSYRGVSRRKYNDRERHQYPKIICFTNLRFRPPAHLLSSLWQGLGILDNWNAEVLTFIFKVFDMIRRVLAPLSQGSLGACSWRLLLIFSFKEFQSDRFWHKLKERKYGIFIYIIKWTYTYWINLANLPLIGGGLCLYGKVMILNIYIQANYAGNS